MADINLVPQEIKVEQERTQVVKKTTLIAVAITIIIGVISAYMLYQSQSLKSRTEQTNRNIQSLRGDINGLAEIEVLARNLDVKSKTVDSVLASRVYYSMLMEALKAQVPESVTVETFGTARDNTINVSGFAVDYLAIAEFANNLADAGDLFADVSLNSVSLDSQTSLAKFFIIVTLNPEALKQ